MCSGLRLLGLQLRHIDCQCFTSFYVLICFPWFPCGLASSSFRRRLCRRGFGVVGDFPDRITKRAVAICAQLLDPRIPFSAEEERHLSITQVRSDLGPGFGNSQTVVPIRLSNKDRWM